MTSALVQSSLSHYIAKRDKCLAELDIYLNRPVGVGDHASVSDEVIKLFAELDSAESVISTIRDVIETNKKEQTAKDEIALLRQQIIAASNEINQQKKHSANDELPSNVTQ